jgi:gluconolactonase
MSRILLVAAFCLAAGAQEFPNQVISRIGAGYRFTEGAAWSKDNYLIFSDTPHDQLLKWTPGSRVEVFREDAHGPSGNAFDVQGRLYTCETRTRRVTRTDKNGKIETLAERWEGKRLNAPAAVVVSKSGHVYFTDPAFGYQEDQRELSFYGVYHIPPKGAMEVVAKPAGRPHGVALSPNGRILYVSNADEHNIRAYDLDRNGEASGERVLVSGIAGVPGGLAVDAEGNLFVAAKGIAIYDPQGHPLRTLGLPEPASSCVLGEGDMKSLFVTARGFVYRLRLGEK